MNRRSWRIWGVFLGVFLAGAVAGGFVSLRLTKPKPVEQSDDFVYRVMQRYSERLQLTEAQRQAIQPHVERIGVDMQRVRTEVAALMQSLEQVLARELTPEQRQTLQMMQAEQRERWRKWVEKKRQHGEHRPKDGDHLPSAPESGPEPKRP